VKITPDYIVGLVDGEGCFEISYVGITQIRPEFRIGMFAGKEEEHLEAVREFLRFGHVYTHLDQRRGKKFCVFVCVSQEELMKAKEFFKRHPPLMKGKQFEVWSRAVDVYRKTPSKERFIELARLREEIYPLINKCRLRKHSFKSLRKIANRL